MLNKLISVGGFTLLSRITGFIRDVLMAWILGKGILSDAFLFAFLFPNYFRAIFGEGTINPAFLPRYAALYAKGNAEAARRFANQVFSWQLAAQLFLLIGAMAAMPQLVAIFVPGYSSDQLALTASLARITFPYLILTLVAIQLSAMLNALEKFWAAAAWSNFLNLAMIGTLLASSRFPNAAYAAAWGVLIGGCLQLVFILWAARRDGISLRVELPRWTPEIAEFFKALGIVTFGAASVVVAPLIDFFIASYLPTGSRTALYYADRINQLPLGVLGIALGTILLPEMSKRLAKDDRAGSDTAQNRSAAMTLLLTLPFAAVFIAIPDTIMRAVFAHGAFDAHSADLAASALAAYGAGLPAMALVRIVASTFYARHDTLTPAIATVTAIVSNIILKVIFVWGFDLGVAGIALGTAVGAWINVAVLTWIGRSRSLLAIESLFIRSLGVTLISTLAAGAGAWFGAKIGASWMPGAHSDLFALAAAVVGSGIGYLLTVLTLRSRLPLDKFSR
ncbi:murein biosynthesis integral membrane protein MurJ [Hyphomicrobium sp.]|jgi:putative peptidoglycan lipid II flippase|uniref:murein biosynthesis integral membrane protein MurJ n=1 Tax=Hyphomicrobium sp. TaxID=82 RepID=UPI00356AA3A7